MKRDKGFSLLELILVLGIGASVSFLKFQDMVQQQEGFLAVAAGQQIKQLGDAVNAYINIRYDKLAVLTAAAGTGNDPGPRTCSAVSSTCTITPQTLINEGLLAPNYVARNSFGSDYAIQLKRNGTAPNYLIDGVVLTNNSWVVGPNVRYDLLGKAMQVAGIDSGMSKMTTQIDGYNGSWSYPSSTFAGINKLGILGYRVGYSSAMYAVYLRRDGTLPMTGDLNLGGNSVSNIRNVVAAGTGTFGGNLTSGGNITANGMVTSGGQISARNGYGDEILFGGDDAGNDYEIKLMADKPLSIQSPNQTANSTIFSVEGNAKTKGRFATNGFDPNDMPAGYSGIRTKDILATGALLMPKSGTAANAGDYAFSISGYGALYAQRSVTAGGWLWGANQVGDQIGIGGDASGDYEIKLNSADKYLNIWWPAYYLQPDKYRDKTILLVNGQTDVDGNLIVRGDIKASGNLDTPGIITASYFKPGATVYEGYACSNVGAIAKTNAGAPLFCVNGMWKSSMMNISGGACYWAAPSNALDPNATGYKTATCKAGHIATGIRTAPVSNLVDKVYAEVQCCPY